MSLREMREWVAGQLELRLKEQDSEGNAETMSVGESCVSVEGALIGYLGSADSTFGDCKKTCQPHSIDYWIARKLAFRS